MGGFFSSMWNKVFKSNRNYNILILGLANAGKTTLLYQMYLLLKAGHLEKLFKPHLQLEAMLKRLLIKMSNLVLGIWEGNNVLEVFGRPIILELMQSSL